MDCDFDRLDLSTNPYLEKNLEFLCNWIDDLSNEQHKFNQYTRNVARQSQVRSVLCARVFLNRGTPPASFASQEGGGTTGSARKAL